MTTTTSTPATSTPASTTRPASRARRRLLGAAPLVVGALTIAALMLIVPWGERNEIGYAAVAPLRDALWGGILTDALALVAVGIGLALVVCRLVPDRGAVWAEVGGVLTVIGAVVFALGGFGYATLAWHVTDASVLDPAAGAALLDHAIDNPEHAILLQVVGFLTFTLGTVLLSFALVRSRAVTRWLPAVILVSTVLVFLAPPRVKDYVQATQMLAFAALGLLSLRDLHADPPARIGR